MSDSKKSGIRSGFKLRHSKSSGSLQNRIVSQASNSPPSNTWKKSLVPSDLCNKLKDQLPQHFLVTSGTYGQDALTTFAVDEKFTTHFIHNLNYLLLKTQSGCFYKAPIHSMINVGLIYDPHQKLDQALNGYIFGRPAALIEASDNPKIVVVINGHTEEDPQYTVEVNDVLFIEGGTTIGRKRFLKCIHVTSGLSKLIREDFSVKLSTRPDRIFLPLYSIIKYVVCPFTAIVEFPKSAQQERTVVASVLAKGEDRMAICTRNHGSKTIMFALPETLDIEFSKLECNREEYETLCIQSADYLRHFNPAKVRYELLTSYSSPVQSESTNTQLAIYTSVSQERDGNIACPQSLQKYFPFKKISASQNPHPSSLESRLTLLEQAVQGLFSEIEGIKERCDKRKGEESSQKTHLAETAFDMVVDLGRVVSKLQTEVTDMKLKSLPNRSLMEKQLSDTDYQPLIPPKGLNALTTRNSSPTPIGHSSNEPLTISAINQQYLKSLNVQQVSEIVSQLGMKEHAQTFQSHNISGEILLHLNESDLLNRLNVSTPAHRLKLMQVITGQESAFPYTCASNTEVL